MKKSSKSCSQRAWPARTGKTVGHSVALYSNLTESTIAPFRRRKSLPAVSAGRQNPRVVIVVVVIAGRWAVAVRYT